MTANTDTTRDPNSSNDQPKNTDADDESSPSLADLTSKQQAIIIATLEHPDEPAVSIATRVGAAQSYPSQVVDNHEDVFNALRKQLEDADGVVDVIERELSEQEIIDIIDRGLLDKVDTRLTEKYTGKNGSNSRGSTADQNNASDTGNTPVDRPVTSQRSFLSAAPDDTITRHSDTCDGQYVPEMNNEQTTLTQTDTGVDTNADSGESPDCSKSGGSVGEETLRQWYKALTEKQRAIIDAIVENPGLTDAHIAEIASKRLPSGESVSRAYVSIIGSEDAAFLEALRDRKIESRIESDSKGDDDREIQSGDNEHNQHRAGTSDNQIQSHHRSISIEELSRVRDRIAFSASVIEQEYALCQDSISRGDEVIPSKIHVTGTVAFARQTLAEINELLEHEKEQSQQ